MHYYETKRIEHAGYSTLRIPSIHSRETMPYFSRTSSNMMQEASYMNYYETKRMEHATMAINFVSIPWIARGWWERESAYWCIGVLVFVHETSMTTFVFAMVAGRRYILNKNDCLTILVNHIFGYRIEVLVIPFATLLTEKSFSVTDFSSRSNGKQLKHDKSSTARVERCSHVPECG